MGQIIIIIVDAAIALKIPGGPGMKDSHKL